MTTSKTPWHIWAVGILSLLWNAGGAMDFTLTKLQNTAYLAQFTPEQLEYFTSFPISVQISWGIAVWSAVAGSVLLLLRNRLAVPMFLIGVAAFIVTAVHNLLLAEVKMHEIVGDGAVYFSVAIFVVAAFLYLYSKSQRTKGNLR